MTWGAAATCTVKPPSAPRSCSRSTTSRAPWSSTRAGIATASTRSCGGRRRNLIAWLRAHAPRRGPSTGPARPGAGRPEREQAKDVAPGRSRIQLDAAPRVSWALRPGSDPAPRTLPRIHGTRPPAPPCLLALPATAAAAPQLDLPKARREAPAKRKPAPAKKPGTGTAGPAGAARRWPGRSEVGGEGRLAPRRRRRRQRRDDGEGRAHPGLRRPTWSARARRSA